MKCKSCQYTEDVQTNKMMIRQFVNKQVL